MSRIALVEDNPDTRILVVAVLGEQHEVAEYETGAAALEGILASVPDLVLLDVSLPDMDGCEVLAGLRADERTAALTVVAFTAHAMEGDSERLLAQGFDAYVSKPIVDIFGFRDLVTSLAEPSPA